MVTIHEELEHHYRAVHDIIITVLWLLLIIQLSYKLSYVIIQWWLVYSSTLLYIYYFSMILCSQVLNRLVSGLCSFSCHVV